MPSHSLRGSKGGRRPQACFDELSTRLPMGHAKTVSSSAITTRRMGFCHRANGGRGGRRSRRRRAAAAPDLDAALRLAAHQHDEIRALARLLGAHGLVRDDQRGAGRDDLVDAVDGLLRDGDALERRLGRARVRRSGSALRSPRCGAGVPVAIEVGPPAGLGSAGSGVIMASALQRTSAPSLA